MSELNLKKVANVLLNPTQVKMLSTMVEQHLKASNDPLVKTELGMLKKKLANASYYFIKSEQK